MLVVDYLRPLPVFCSEEGGCEALKHTVFAAPLGVPMPLIGLAGFVALGVTGLVPGKRARSVELTLAVGAGFAGATLLVLQALLGHLCPYCCVADGSALLALAAAAWRVRLPSAPPLTRGFQLGGAAALLGAAAAPLGVGFHVDTTPVAIADELSRTPRGQVTVVDFVDFECPYCRLTDAELEPVLESHRDRIHLVRRQVPLKQHPHALDAARAACCGEKLGQGDAMASALFASEVDDLTPEGCEKIASRLGLSTDAYRACVASPETDASIAADKAEFKAAGGHALPTVWVGATPIIGAQPQKAFAGAMHDALAKAGS
jgi:protein-disulfide isomerase